MLKTLLIAGAFACLPFAANAAECEFPFDATITDFTETGAEPYVIPDDKLAAVVSRMETILGGDLGEVTRGFFVSAGGSILLGLEVDDCLLPPFKIGPAPAADHLSGKDPKSGQIGA